jgi:hypothetical protein
MSARRLVKQAERTGSLSGSMPCIYGDRYRRGKWRWGVKKGLRRARRRLGRDIIRHEVHPGTH